MLANLLIALGCRSPVLGAILTLVSGTATAQVITLVLQVFIARVYSDVDKGLFGVYGSITGFVITFAAMRFDLAIMLPKSDLAARVLLRLASRCIIASSLLTSLVCVVGAQLLHDHYTSTNKVILQFSPAASTTPVISSQSFADREYPVGL